MDVNITCQPAYALAYVRLEAGESVLVERAGMALMSSGIEVSAGLGSGGVVKAAMRKTLGGESFFMGRYTAAVHGAWVAVAPRYPGDITEVVLVPGDDLLVEAGSLLAVADTVEVDVRWGGLRNIVLREGATLLRLAGRGVALVCSYGGIQHMELADGESVVVDTGHLVGYSTSCQIRVGPLSGVTTAVVTGEGMVGEIIGPGSVYIQTRSEQSIRSWLFPDNEQNKGGRGRS